MNLIIMTEKGSILSLISDWLNIMGGLPLPLSLSSQEMEY